MKAVKIETILARSNPPETALWATMRSAQGPWLALPLSCNILRAFPSLSPISGNYSSDYFSVLVSLVVVDCRVAMDTSFLFKHYIRAPPTLRYQLPSSSFLMS